MKDFDSVILIFIAFFFCFDLIENVTKSIINAAPLKPNDTMNLAAALVNQSINQLNYISSAFQHPKGAPGI